MTNCTQSQHIAARKFGALLFFALLSCAWLPNTAHGQAADDMETKTAKVKAAFLLNFARYVEWPERTFSSSNSPVIIAVFGLDPFGRNLDVTVEGRTVEKHPVQVKRVQSVAELGECHVVFVSATERDRVRGLLGQVRTKPILTVSDMDGFTLNGGIILLKKKQGMMRFDINREAAERAGLKISSKLLKLADN